MEVVDTRRAAWFLLRDGDDLLLDASCNHHAFGYSVLIRLDEAERHRLATEGRGYLDELADAIHMSAPAARGSTSPYRARDLHRARSDEVTAAVRAWRAAGGNNSS